MADLLAVHSPEAQRALRQAYRTAVWIGAAMIASVVMYGVVAHVIAAQQAPFAGFVRLPQIGVVRLLLYAFAAVQIVLIRLLRSALLAKPAALDLGALIQRLQVATVVTYAFCEVPALLGLILLLLNGFFGDFYVLVLLSLVLFGAYFPRFDAWVQWAAAAEGPAR